MKTLSFLTAAAIAVSALSAPVIAHDNGFAHIHTSNGIVTPTGPKPAWAHRIDPEILNPKPKPFPWPGPVCLSCPPYDVLDERVINPRVLGQ